HPPLSRSYGEIAGESRSQNQSQGTGGLQRKGSILNYFDQLAGDPARSDMFEGIDTSWSRYSGGDEVGKVLQQASDTFDPKNLQKTIQLLMQELDGLDHLGEKPAWDPRGNALIVR